jgi:hypothetical protein
LSCHRGHRRPRPHPPRASAHNGAGKSRTELLKGGSSKWVHDGITKDFAWQSAYGAFSIGISQKDATVAYIVSQAEHHKRRDYQQEFVAFLKKHDVAYDPRYIWG